MVELIANHLWQSTLFAGAVALLAFAFRHHSARVRYWLWLAASLKFLIPFSALISLGGQFDVFTVQTAPYTVIGAVDTAAQPFSQPGPPRPMVRVGNRFEERPQRSTMHAAVPTIWMLGAVAILLAWGVRWRAVARQVRGSTPIESGPVVDVLRRLERSGRPLPVVASAAPMEPGIFGVARPVLVWPERIGDRLSEAQIEAILAHELAHVRRHDNLAAAVHMGVQALFWFHPVVWWIGARLVDERERACDEDVVRLGTEPHVYAESILKTCQFYVESPLVCVAGVTGADLKKRVEHIMKNDSTVVLSIARRLVLGTALVASIAIPVAIGIVTSPRLAAQITAPAADAPTFEVASVKPTEPGTATMGRGVPGRFSSQNMTVRRMIRQAYDIHETQIVGGPDWVTSQGYTIEATTGNKPREQTTLMMKTLLRDRFKLAFHTEKRDLPIYALVVQRSDGRLGPGLKRIPDDECPPPGSPRGARPGGPPPPAASPFDPNAVAACGSIIFGPGRLLAHGVPIDMLVRSLANLPAITAFNRPVTNLTKLEGVYDFDFRFNNDFGRGGPPAPGGPVAASIPGDEPVLFTALQEQLGLKLEPQRATLDVLIIDSIDRPTEN